MKNLKKNLQTVNKDLKALAKKVDKIMTAVDQLGKTKTSKKHNPSQFEQKRQRGRLQKKLL